MTFFLEELNKYFTNKVFSDLDIRLLFCNRTSQELTNQISYYLRTKKLIKFKRGLYSTLKQAEFSIGSKFELANQIYQPSYISFESALSYHQLIPEAVQEITSACYQNKRKLYTNSLGNFSYQYIPVTPFYLDIKNYSQYNIANPLRALFDLLYLNRRIYNHLGDLTEDLRIDESQLAECLSTYLAKDIYDLADLYKKKNIKILAQVLVESFK